MLGVKDVLDVVAEWQMKVGEEGRPGDGATLPRMVEVAGVDHVRGLAKVRMVMTGHWTMVPIEEVEAWPVRARWVRGMSLDTVLALMSCFLPGES